MRSDICVDRCLCYGVSFAKLRVEADESGAATVSELQRGVLFGEGCKLCHPYVRRMLRTGETVFRELIHEGDAPNTGAGA